MSQSYLYLWRALNWPNRISLMRLLCIAPFVVLLIKQNQWPYARYAAIGLFVLMALSDALDGYLARRNGESTRLGKFLDPLADKLLIACSVCLLATYAAAVPDARVPVWVVVCVIGKDLWVVVGFVVLYMITDRVRIQPTWAGKWCTTMQLVMVSVVLAAPDINRLLSGAGTWAAAATGWAVLAMCVVAVASYTRLGVIFLAEAGEAPSVEETWQYRDAKRAIRAQRRARRRRRPPSGSAANDEV